MPPPEARTLCAAGLALASTLIALAPARADDTPEQKLRAVQRELEQSRTQQDKLTRQADALALELQTLRADGIRAAEAVQTHEATLSTLEAQLQSLAADEAQKQAVIARDRAHEAELLAALARLALNPPEVLALGPLAPEDAVRTGILLSNTLPRLRSEAQSLSLELSDLHRLRQEIERKRLAAELERRGLDKDRQRLDGLIRRKTALRDQALQGAEDTKQHLDKLSSEAGDLHDLITKLDADRKTSEDAIDRQAQVAAIPRPDVAVKPETVTAPPPVSPGQSRPRTVRPFDKARGAMVYPASGTLVLRYGELDEFGVSSKGLTLMTRAGAVVVAPYDGQVEFAGPFKGYGQILIIQHGDGYHSLLAGLERIDGAVGDWLVAGEP
ncbi:MAG TPA: peptidoglycan DD-metalloendopeptidase family protein, partial [Stellaceae bacterium]|nr:peptidoglycan DD-metalloendopeptidase family protein [Stellaceae bacterium]